MWAREEKRWVASEQLTQKNYTKPNEHTQKKVENKAQFSVFLLGLTTEHVECVCDYAIRE